MPRTAARLSPGFRIGLRGGLRIGLRGGPHIGLLVGGLGVLAAGRAAACALALALAVDVSGSVDDEEYATQMHGLAAALRDGAVAEALVRGQAQVMVVEWTGASRQAVVVPWTPISDFSDVDELARRVETAPRPWRNYATAVGEALDFASARFAAVSCRRRVIDISGDGESNEGRSPRSLRPMLKAGGITVNALVIETGDDDLTAWFWENVITGPGAFVVTARGYAEYPARIRQKLLRETTRQLAQAAPSPPRAGRSEGETSGLGGGILRHPPAGGQMAGQETATGSEAAAGSSRQGGWLQGAAPEGAAPGHGAAHRVAQADERV